MERNELDPIGLEGACCCAVVLARAQDLPPNDTDGHESLGGIE